MLIRFEVAGETVEFYRNWFTGRTELRRGDRIIPLLSALDPTAHFSLTLTRVLQHRLGNHDITIEKVRPLLFAGFRPQSYRVLVDGVEVAQRSGY
jgi:hypothetical protein